MKAALIDLRKLSGAVETEVKKKRKFKTLETKVDNLNEKILDATTLILVNQYKTDKQILEKKMEI